MIDTGRSLATKSARVRLLLAVCESDVLLCSPCRVDRDHEAGRESLN